MVLNGGHVYRPCLKDKDRFGKYTICYLIKTDNRSFIAFSNLVNVLMKNNKLDCKLPWEEEDGKASIFMGSSKEPILLDIEGGIMKPEDFIAGLKAKARVTPNVYSISNEVNLRLPDGSMKQVIETKTGVNIFLNAIQVVKADTPEEVIFE